MARLLATLQRHKKRLDQLRASALMLEFGGAAGTLAPLGDRALECQKRLANELELAQPDIAWHTERDCIADVGAFLALLCGTLSKNATDIKVNCTHTHTHTISLSLATYSLSLALFLIVDDAN